MSAYRRIKIPVTGEKISIKDGETDIFNAVEKFGWAQE